MAENPIPILTIIGRSGSGKTTLIEKLIEELSEWGYRLATVKYHSHPGFEIDMAGKDSWRFAQAGSQQVVIASLDKFATYRNLEREMSLDEVVAEIRGVDLILVEGYRSSNKPNIEVLRVVNGLELVGAAERRIALAADVKMELGVPWFNLNEIAGIADLIEGRFLRKKS